MQQSGCALRRHRARVVVGHSRRTRATSGVKEVCRSEKRGLSRSGAGAAVNLRGCRANPCARKAVFRGGEREEKERRRGEEGKGTANNYLCTAIPDGTHRAPSLLLPFRTLEARRPQPPELAAHWTKPRARSLPSFLPSFLTSVRGSRISTGIQSE